MSNGPQYATTPDHQAWRGNTEPSYSRPITPPATDSASLERAEILLELRGALIGAASIAKLLGTTGVRDYEFALDAILQNIRSDRAAILEGEKG
ncbi:MAG: hypothetical protein ACR2RF_03660 [Geminicoccaceae bacterium]